MGLGRFPCAGGRHGARADPAFRSGPRGMHLLHAMLPAQLYCVMCCGVLSGCLLSRQLDAQCRASSAPLRDLLDAPTAQLVAGLTCVTSIFCICICILRSSILLHVR